MMLLITTVMLSALLFVILSFNSKARLESSVNQIASSRDHLSIYSEYKRASSTAIICAIGGGLLTMMFAVTFFSGGELDPALWSGGQIFAVLVGLVVVIAITAAQYRLYQSIDGNISGTIITCLILAFVVFSEIATTAERENELVKYRSAQSPTLLASLDAIRSTGNSQLTGYEQQIANTQQSLSRSRTQLELCANDNCRAKYKALVNENNAVLNRYQQLHNQAIQARVDNTALLLDNAKSLEIDERQHTAIVKFMSHVFDVTNLSASIFISFIFVIAFELSFHFSASRKAILKRALAQLGYATEKQQQPIKIVSSESVYTRTDTDKTEQLAKPYAEPYTDNTRTNTDVTRTDTDSIELDHDIDDLKRRYSIAQSTEKGHSFDCPYCQSSLIKTVYNKLFCSPECKDKYHNAIKPERAKFAKN